MEHLELDYKNIELVSRAYAGRKGFQFRHEDEIIITVFVNDVQLVSAIDKALKAEYKTDEDE